MIQIFNPASSYQACSDPVEIFSLPSIDAQADAIVPALLGLYVRGVDYVNTPSLQGRIPRTPPFAPFSWGTKNSELARAIEAKLRTLGVREELCTVQSGTTEEGKGADEAFGKVMTELMRGMGSVLPTQASPGRAICGGCKKDSSWFSGGLLKCSRCGNQSYCSRDCQKKDWRQHKNTCGNSGGSAGPGSSSTSTGRALDPYEYYHKVAHTVPEAKTLADSINLPLPPTGGGLS